MPEKSKSIRRISLEPIFWSSLIYILGLVLLFYYFPKQQNFVASNYGPPVEVIPQQSILPIIIYFFAVVIILGIILYIVPVSKLRLFLKILFGAFYAWGTFIILYIMLPFNMAGILAAVIAVGVAALWFLFSLVWLQNLLLIVTLVSVAGVFGSQVSPWTVIFLLLALSIYDIVAVSLGYMMWLARKLSEADTLPAFIMPRSLLHWNLNLKGATVKKLFDEESSEREFSLLGGGDLGFPMIFVVAVYFHAGVNALSDALIVAGASMVGLIFAYLLQIYLLKGKPLPALPPISFFSIIGFLIVNYLVH